METLLVPVPPLAEQRRIVRKLDQLMALCDRLEAALLAASTTRARLLESVLRDVRDSETGASESTFVADDRVSTATPS